MNKYLIGEKRVEESDENLKKFSPVKKIPNISSADKTFPQSYFWAKIDKFEILVKESDNMSLGDKIFPCRNFPQTKIKN